MLSDYQIFYLFKVSGLKQNYNYSVSDVNSDPMLDSNSDYDSHSSLASINLIIFLFSILC